MTAEEIIKLADNLNELAVLIDREESRIIDMRWEIIVKDWTFYSEFEKQKAIDKLHRSIQIKEAVINRLKDRVNKLLHKS